MKEKLSNLWCTLVPLSGMMLAEVLIMGLMFWFGFITKTIEIPSYIMSPYQQEFWRGFSLICAIVIVLGSVTVHLKHKYLST
jgi:hypothetical protein